MCSHGSAAASAARVLPAQGLQVLQMCLVEGSTDPCQPLKGALPKQQCNDRKTKLHL